jgi:GTP cyclohydrolase I
MRKEIRTILEEIGENPEREGLVKTPERVERAYQFLTSGYKLDVTEIINEAVFHEDIQDMVIVKNIEVYSLCEHHLLPFYGKCHVGYIPNGKVIGLSKIPRIVDAYAHRLQIQERLTRQIANTLQSHLNPLGLGVVIEAKHLCMMMRGVEKQNSEMVTNAMLGSFRSKISTRSEFLSSIKGF